MKWAAIGLGLTLMMPGSPSLAQNPAARAASPVNYADPANWLCRPKRDDACRTDLRSTVLDARGRTRVEGFKPHRSPPIDCFYVYPTVSERPG